MPVKSTGVSLQDDETIESSMQHLQLGDTLGNGEEEQLNGIEDEDEFVPSNSGLLGKASNVPQVSMGGGNYCVVKPIRGVASDDVYLCQDLEQVKKAFERIHESPVFGATQGETNDAVLVQEFATGTEYAVDIVSKAGEHKVAALWRYDKRPMNGAPFVYHATEVVDADTTVGRAVCQYAMQSLDALGVHWGTSHVEVIAPDGDESSSPRLVEVNCRQHNTDFAPLTSACMGYNALDMLLAAYLGDATEFPPDTEHMRLKWDTLPDLPVTRAYGAIVHLVSHVEGTITGVNQDAMEEIEHMESVLNMDIYPQFLKIGNHVSKTVDIRSDAGAIHIMNDDEEQFQRDYERIVELMPDLFPVDSDKEEATISEVMQGNASDNELESPPNPQELETNDTFT
jgi:hypothetical protein